MTGRLRSLALIGVPALVLIGALTVWLYGGRYASTENAFVKADITQMASEVPGRIVDVRPVLTADTYLSSLAGNLNEWNSPEDEAAFRGL